MRQGTRWGVIAMMGVLVGCSNGEGTQAPGASSISGTYVALGHEASMDRIFVEALRLTQTAPGQFTGTLESTSVTNAGKSTSYTQNVMGSYDGNHVGIAIGGSLAGTNRSATWSPGLITMSWVQQDGRLAHEQFKAQTDEEYGEILRDLSTERQRLAATSAAQTKAKRADEEAALLATRLQQFLAKEAMWTTDPATTRHQKSLAFADRGVEKIKALLAQHQSMANVVASNVAVAMSTQGIQLGVALDGDDEGVATAQQNMAALDHAIGVSPCLSPDGSLVPNPLPACAPLPELVARYRAAHASAQALLARIAAINTATRSDYDARLKEVQGLVAIR